MSAQDNLNGDQFYHGTRHEFRPGDILTPGEAAKNANHFASSPKHVNYADDLGFAAHWGPNVYKVTPLSNDARHAHDTEPGWPREYEYRTRKGLRVDEQVPADEVERAKKDRQDRRMRSKGGKEWLVMMRKDNPDFMKD